MSLTQKLVGAVAAVLLAVPVFANTDAAGTDTTASTAASQTLATAADTDMTAASASLADNSANNPAAAKATMETVNINTADAKQLAAAIKGLGEKKATAIVDYRTKNGAFKTVDDLAKVKGIGKKFIEKHRSQLTVG